MAPKQTITITPVENGWMIHVNQPLAAVHNRTFVARNAAEVSEIVEDLALEQSMEVPF